MQLSYRLGFSRDICYRVILSLVMLLLVGCGDKGSSQTENPPPPTALAKSLTPHTVKVVEVSSIEVGVLAVSWLPAQDDQTPPEKLVYGVHISTQKGFHPAPSTLKTSVTGGVSAQVRGLQAGETYYVIITATDEDKNVSWSNHLEGKTVAIAAKRTGVVVHEVSASQAQQLASQIWVRFKAKETLENLRSAA